MGLTKILAFAAPNATAVLLGSDCTAYPNYDNATGIAEPLRVVVDSTGKELDGFKFIPKYAIAVGGGSWGFVCGLSLLQLRIPDTSNQYPLSYIVARSNAGEYILIEGP